MPQIKSHPSSYVCSLNTIFWSFETRSLASTFTQRCQVYSTAKKKNLGKKHSIWRWWNFPPSCYDKSFNITNLIYNSQWNHGWSNQLSRPRAMWKRTNFMKLRTKAAQLRVFVYINGDFRFGKIQNVSKKAKLRRWLQLNKPMYNSYSSLLKSKQNNINKFWKTNRKIKNWKTRLSFYSKKRQIS